MIHLASSTIGGLLDMDVSFFVCVPPHVSLIFAGPASVCPGICVVQPAVDLSLP